MLGCWADLSPFWLQRRRASRPLRMELIVPGQKFPDGQKENARICEPCEILVASPGRLLHLLREFQSSQPNFISKFFRRTTFVVVDEADSLMLKVERDGEQHTAEILKSLRSDIQMLYHGSITIPRWDCQEATPRIEGLS